MKTSAKVNVQDGIFKVNFDIFEAVWGYLLYDNISLLADSKSNNLKLYSFMSGKEQTSADISKENLEELSKSQIIEINYALGNNQTAVFKKEAIDTTGKFIEAIEAQFKGRNATAIECYKAVIEANPNNYRALGLMGRCLRAEGKMDDAYECYKKAIEIAPDSPEAYCNLGVLFQKAGDEEKAQASFYKAIEVDNFYCNALVKRSKWLLENKPDSNELKLYNLRISAVHQDVTAAQNHIKAYMEKMEYDRNAYSDKETALFGDYADYKLQKKLRTIESCVNNGAYGSALKNMNEVLESSKGTSAESLVASWCHSRASRSSKRLGEKLNNEIFEGLNKIIDSTPEPQEDEMIKFVQDAELKISKETKTNETERPVQHLSKDALSPAKPVDREAAEAASLAAISKIENKVDEYGDYSQPIAGPIEKEITKDEKAEALEEQALLYGNDDMVPPPPTSDDSLLTASDDIPAPKPVMMAEPEAPEPAPVNEPVSDTNDLLMGGIDDIPAPKPISEDAMLTGMDDIPAPKPVMMAEPEAPEPASVNEPVSDTNDLLMGGIDDIPAPKPISEDAMLTGIDDIPAPKPSMEINTIAQKPVVESEPSLKPKSTAELMAEAKPVLETNSEPTLKPMSTAELMAESKDINMSSAEPETFLKPMSTAELMAKAKEIDVSSSESDTLLKPMSTAELMEEAKNVTLPPEPVLANNETPAKPTAEANKADMQTKGSLSENYKSPVKGVNPVTVQEFFMLVLFEVMRDGDIEEPEKKFLNNLKGFLKISDSDYGKMFNHVAKQVAVKGKLDKGPEGKFNPKRVFRNLCKAALRDGVLADSEKKILIAASKLFKISENEFKAMLLEAKK